MSGEMEAILDPNDPDQHIALNDVDKSSTKAEAAVTMALYGASYTDIAKTLHYSSAYRARMAVERVLATAANSPTDRAKMRQLIDKRLNRLLAAHIGKALDPNDPQQLAHSARVLAIIDRQAKLHGVDAPQQIQISASDEHIQAYVEAMMPEAQRDQQAIEADIMDADIVEEG